MKELEPYNIIVIYTPMEVTESSDNSLVEHSFCVYATSTKDAVKGLMHLYAGVTIVAIIFGDDDE